MVAAGGVLALADWVEINGVKRATDFLEVWRPNAEIQGAGGAPGISAVLRAHHAREALYEDIGGWWVIPEASRWMDAYPVGSPCVGSRAEEVARVGPWAPRERSGTIAIVIDDRSGSAEVDIWGLSLDRGPVVGLSPWGVVFCLFWVGPSASDSV